MKRRILGLASLLSLALISCDKEVASLTASGSETLTLAPRLELAAGADSALYASVLNVRVRLDAGAVHRDTLVAFALRRCVFDGVPRGVGFQLGFHGIDAHGDTVWTGSASGMSGQDQSSGVAPQLVSVPVRFTDRSGPVFLEAPRDTVVPAGLTDLVVGWRLSPESGLSANLNGLAAQVGSNGQILSNLPLGKDSTVAVLLARDSLGNISRDTMIVRRRWDSEPPGFLATPRDTSVPYAVSSLALDWSFVPEPGLGISLNDSALEVPNGLLRLDLPLPVGLNSFVLSLRDSAGNLRRDTVTVTRRLAAASGDSVAPVFLQVPRDTTVSSGTTGLPLAWAVHWEPGLSATFAGQSVVVENSGAIHAAAALTGDTTAVVLVLRDSLENERRDTVRICRRKSSQDAPPVLLSAPRDTAVPYGTNAISLTWTLKGSSAMIVSLDGQILPDIGPTWSRTVALEVGTRNVVLSAVDSFGQVLRDTVTITREPAPDVDAPAILQRPLDTLVGFDIESYVATWKLVLEPKLTVTINGTAVSGSAGLYSRAVGLKVGRDTLLLVAVDSVGNARRDTLYLTRQDSFPDYGIPWNPKINYGLLRDDRDGQVYRTVKIGSLTWMAQNLNYKGEITDTGKKYGSLYRWAEALGLGSECDSFQDCRDSLINRRQGVCPAGWVVPDTADFHQLISIATAIVMNNTALSSSVLQASAQWDSKGRDELGFRLIPWNPKDTAEVPWKSVGQVSLLHAGDALHGYSGSYSCPNPGCKWYNQGLRFLGSYGIGFDASSIAQRRYLRCVKKPEE